MTSAYNMFYATSGVPGTDYVLRLPQQPRENGGTASMQIQGRVKAGSVDYGINGGRTRCPWANRAAQA